MAVQEQIEGLIGVRVKSPLSRAEHRRCGRNERVGLSERQRVPTRAVRIVDAQGQAGHGGFFWLLFFNAKEK